MKRITEGWIYMMTNESMPDLIKIGYSGNDPVLRAEQLNTTGTPTAFKVIYRGFVDDAYELEQRLHESFKANRVSNDREFFSIDPEEVYKKIHQLDSPTKEDIDFDITENSDPLKKKLSRADFSKLNYKEQKDYILENYLEYDEIQSLSANELVCCLCRSDKKELDWRQTDEGKEETKKFPLGVQCTDTRQSPCSENLLYKIFDARSEIEWRIESFYYSDIFADHDNDYSVTLHTDVDVDLIPRLKTREKIECSHKFIPYKYEEEWTSTIDNFDPVSFTDEWKQLEKNEGKDECWIYGNEYIKALFSYEDKVADLFIKDGYKLSSISISEINRFEKKMIRDMKNDFKNYKRNARVSMSLFESLSSDGMTKEIQDRKDKEERRLKKALSSKQYEKLMKKKEKVVKQVVKKAEAKRKRELGIKPSIAPESAQEEHDRLKRMGPEMVTMAKGKNFDYHARIKELELEIDKANRSNPSQEPEIKNDSPKDYHSNKCLRSIGFFNWPIIFHRKVDPICKKIESASMIVSFGLLGAFIFSIF